MTRLNLHMLTACLLASFSAAGCTSMNTVARGQNPELVPSAGVTYSHGHQPIRAVVDEAVDCYHEHHNTTTTYHNGNVGQYAPARGGQACPPGGAGAAGGEYYGNCPHGNCPNNGGCPHGCRSCGNGNDLNWYPKHGYSYSYKRPNDLVYPAQGAVGGAVVYPYYTHKGPSDFFRKE
ncbi:hypothetical protein [Planctomicrobium sp. SH664]|uniref:hypothetical protein n=1 Tax=Planctomicrobium sp. SH664 TaxID=3448125 RepID=UPI003F5B26BF